jgi:hypothetical protein
MHLNCFFCRSGRHGLESGTTVRNVDEPCIFLRELSLYRCYLNYNCVVYRLGLPSPSSWTYSRQTKEQDSSLNNDQVHMVLRASPARSQLLCAGMVSTTSIVLSMRSHNSGGNKQKLQDNASPHSQPRTPPSTITTADGPFGWCALFTPM